MWQNLPGYSHIAGTTLIPLLTHTVKLLLRFSQSWWIEHSASTVFVDSSLPIEARLDKDLAVSDAHSRDEMHAAVSHSSDALNLLPPTGSSFSTPL